MAAVALRIAFALAALYAGWVFYSRYRSGQELQEQMERRRIEADRKIVDQFGGDELKILSFSADAQSVHSGGRVVLCYGVANAASVKIEPEVEPLRPALTHCTEVFPKKTTTYKLTADKQNRSVSASITVAVK